MTRKVLIQNIIEDLCFSESLKIRRQKSLFVLYLNVWRLLKKKYAIERQKIAMAILINFKDRKTFI